MAGDFTGRVRLDDLSPSDHAYLERIKRGEERLYANRLIWPQVTWEGADSLKIEISGEYAAALADKGSDFETALASILRHVGSKLERNEWEFESIMENESFDSDYPGFGGGNKHAFLYTATFRIEKRAEKKAQEYWPLAANPKNWQGPPGLMIHVWADGEIAKVEPDNSSK
jgi:hypothetical protein